MKCELEKEYLLPKRIASQQGRIENAECLLSNQGRVIFTQESNVAAFYGPCFIVLDFGEEIQGGARILSHKFSPSYHQRIRLRFGESFGEANAELGEKNATNDHSIRDLSFTLNHLSDFEFGKTGFRFLRIDFLDEGEYRIENIYASYTHTKLKATGRFASNDVTTNAIFKAAERTIYLNLQEELLEGIKRDRLVWMGDMQQEVEAMVWLYPENDYIERAVTLSLEKNPLPCWFGNIPTYSFCLPQILFEHYLHTGNPSLSLASMDYLEGIVRQLDPCVSEDGRIDYSLGQAKAREGFFFDWPSAGMDEECQEANRFIFLLGLESYDKLRKSLGLKKDEISVFLQRKLRKSPLKNLQIKSVVALGYLAKMIPEEVAREKLLKDGAKGVSIHYSYAIFKAIAELSSVKKALEICNEFYGAMLSRGATTFWENFDLGMLEGSGAIDMPTPKGMKDIHGDFGDHCYKGYRLSLCHGWSVGPIPFLFDSVLGVKVLEPGCKVLSIHPDLGNLKEISASFPTPYGLVSIEAKNGADTKITAPKEIRIVER